MPVTLSVPENYGYVLLAATASSLLGFYHMTLTGQRRKAARVPYPNAYSTAVEAATSQEKFLFNCAQRAHANFSENYPIFLVNLFIAGLGYPQTAAGVGAVWTVSRALYAFGYTREKNNENGKGRRLGTWWVVPHVVLIGLAFASGYKALA